MLAKRRRPKNGMMAKNRDEPINILGVKNDTMMEKPSFSCTGRSRGNDGLPWCEAIFIIFLSSTPLGDFRVSTCFYYR